QRHAEPLGGFTLSFLAVPICGKANNAENDGAKNIGRTGQGEAQRLKILQVVHVVVYLKISLSLTISPRSHEGDTKKDRIGGQIWGSKCSPRRYRNIWRPRSQTGRFTLYPLLVFFVSPS